MNVTDFAVSLLNAETARDRQRSIGPSQIGDPCLRHLAYALVSETDVPQKYWLGAVIGTAIHALLEERVGDREGAIVEEKVYIGELEGYGTINGSADLVLEDEKLLIDWKTTSRPKIKKLKDFVYGVKDDDASRYTMQKYLAQTQLYAWGLNRSGIEVDKIAICFINRDGTCETDVWTYDLAYDEAFAVAIWDRLGTVWKELQDGKHPQDYDAHPECYKCSIGIEG